MECSEDADWIDRYGQDGYVCDADSSSCACIARATPTRTATRSPWTRSYCTTDSSDYDCTDGCQSDGRSDYTWPMIECQDDGECGVGEDDCPDDDN